MEGVLRPGTILLGKYRVESVLGRGGMGIVLKVTHLNLGEELAVKVLLPESAINPDVTARFLREAQSVVRLRGEHVARVTDVGMLPEGLPFIVMEYLRGVDLSGELHQRATLPVGEAVDYVLQACEALAEAHAHGIVHRDIKPANLFLTTRPDGTPLVKVLDFGISKAPPHANNQATKTEMLMGTPGYMSPEQMRASKDVDARTDIWALGIVLYEFLGGRRPFSGESFLAIALMAGTEPPPPLDARIPRGLQAAVLRCLEKDRRARFPSIAELAAALAPFARNQREAATVVERTNLLLQRQSGASGSLELAASSSQALAATTLSGSAGAASGGAASSPPRHRRAVAGGILVLGAVVAFAVVASRAPADKDVRAANTTAPIVVQAPPAANSADAPKKQKVAHCDELIAEKRWPAVLACASELEALGVEDTARKLRAVATLETTSEAIDRKAREALAIRNFKEAETLLKQMAPESVYHKALSDLFDKADAGNVEETKQIMRVYLDAHDCKGLKGLKQDFSQDTSTSGTERMIEEFNHAITLCMGGARPGPGPVSVPVSVHDKKPPSRSSSPQAAAPAPPAPAGRGPHQAAAGEHPVAAGSSGNGAQPGKSNCDEIDVDEFMAEAKDQFNAGAAASALTLMGAALGCRQNDLMYRLAGTYACRAHDVKAARQYFAKVPAQFQSAIEQACQSEGIDIRGS